MCAECGPGDTLEGKGSYILLISLPAAREITIGSLGTIHFEPGGYAYVGSARGGLKGRVGYHLKKNKKPRWHIDYLLEFAVIENVLTIETDERLECAIASMLNNYFETISRFGSSDCKCRGHLFFAPDIKELRLRAAESLNLLASRQNLQVDFQNNGGLSLPGRDIPVFNE